MFFILKKVPVVFMVYFIAGVVKLLRPLVFIRFGSFYSDKIGPLMTLPGYYLLEKDHGIQPQNTIDIFSDGYGVGKNISNQKLLEMYKRLFRKRKGIYLCNGIFRVFYAFARSNAIANDHIIQTAKNGRDVHGLLEKSKIYLEFTQEEKDQAKSEMEKMGIKEGDSFICLLNRDQGYLSKIFPSRDWDYHSYRNIDINDYMPTVEELTQKGYFVVRMGVVVNQLMKIKNSKVIEYSHRGFRTELLDIYLAAHCNFFLTSGSGLDAIPWFFKRPDIYTNIAHVELLISWPSNCLLIFRKYWLKKNKRFMSLKEMIESGAGRCECTEGFEKMGIELIKNTPEEIQEVVSEMDQRLKGTWKEQAGDVQLQKEFWSHFESSPLHGPIRAKIGSKFLRQNQDVLIPKKIPC